MRLHSLENSFLVKLPLHSPSAGGGVKSQAVLCAVSSEGPQAWRGSIHHLVTQAVQSHLDVAPHQLALIHLKGPALFISGENG